jgi:hypothetical protein
MARQKTLPTMENRAIQPLQDAALEYAEHRDTRKGWTKKERAAKEQVLKLMNANNKTHYAYNGVTVDLVAEKETVKVRIKKAKRQKQKE